MMTSAPAKRLVFLTWVLVAFFYFYLSWGYIRATMNDRQFEDYLQYIVKVAGQEQRPSKEIRALILVKADELSLPLKGDQIIILGGGDSLNIRVRYAKDIDIPLLERAVYTKEFDHFVKFKSKQVTDQ